MAKADRLGATQRELIALIRENGNAINTYRAQTQIARYGAGYVSVVSRALWRLYDRRIVKREGDGDLTSVEQATLASYVESHPRARAVWVLAEEYHNHMNA